MKFDTPRIQSEWPDIHPDVRAEVEKLDAYCTKLGMPEVVVTCLHRTREENFEIYGEDKFSWHCVWSAADLRSREYTRPERDMLMEFIRKECGQPFWEVLEHDVGRGSHWHLGRRDFAWRKQHQQNGRH